jgi:transcriptional regulator with GAF, ATPase, and Fis domain
MNTTETLDRGIGTADETPLSPTEFKLGADPIPTWRDAKAALERWLLTEALRRTNGNMAAAGRLLGVTKVAVLHAVRRHSLQSLTRPIGGNNHEET